MAVFKNQLNYFTNLLLQRLYLDIPPPAPGSYGIDSGCDGNGCAPPAGRIRRLYGSAVQDKGKVRSMNIKGKDICRSDHKGGDR